MREPSKNKKNLVGRAGLPKAMIEKIQALRAMGKKYREIAKICGVSVKTVCRYCQTVGLNVRDLEETARQLRAEGDRCERLRNDLRSLNSDVSPLVEKNHMKKKEVKKGVCLIEHDLECPVLKRLIEIGHQGITPGEVSGFCAACIMRRNAKEDRGKFEKQMQESLDSICAAMGVKTIRPPDEPQKKDDEEPKEDGSRDDDRAG